MPLQGAQSDVSVVSCTSVKARQSQCGHSDLVHLLRYDDLRVVGMLEPCAHFAVTVGAAVRLTTLLDRRDPTYGLELAAPTRVASKNPLTVPPQCDYGVDHGPVHTELNMIGWPAHHYALACSASTPRGRESGQQDSAATAGMRREDSLSS